MSRCLYHAPFEAFIQAEDNAILGELCDRYHGDALTTTREAWKSEISIMKGILSRFAAKDGEIIFEYDIPRLGKRIDVVLLYKGIVFCLEFKVGETRILESDVDQVLDYALDLKNFHKFSEDRIIVPILIATNYRTASTDIHMSVYDDRVVNPLVTGKIGLNALIDRVLAQFPDETPVNPSWIISPYAPTPTIIEAARSLYENHTVEDITRHEADKVSTDRTIAYILDVIRKSKANQEKSICFVTGVPGAGKTLVGLDVAVKQTYQGGDAPIEEEQAVYLSGNGPLVAVLNEALAQDNYRKCREKGEGKVTYSEDLHLSVSLRSFRAEKLSAFVHALLSFDSNAAALYNEIKDRYPIVLTRDMAKARKWLHNKVRGSERTGVLVTKEAARFKPLAVHILPTGDENAVHWFLDDKSDVRSSNYLEDAATEIQVQGLELDYTCVLWDADMRYENSQWHFYKFNGQTRWVEQIGNTESKQELQKYMLNAYRVLLTRARAGMVICIPKGNPNKTVSGFWEDSTRLPEYYDSTYQYLKSLGIEEI